MLVGECGVSPEYFFDCMTFSEISIFLDGYIKRQRVSWEQTRTIAYIIAQVNNKKRISPTSILKFDWDNKFKSETSTPEEMNKLRERAKQVEKQMNHG